VLVVGQLGTAGTAAGCFLFVFDGTDGTDEIILLSYEQIAMHPGS
jgi:hypothetical protein